MGEKIEFDPRIRSHQFIVAGLVGAVEDDGLTMHQTFELLEDIKKQVWPALLEVQKEQKEKS